MNACKKGPKKRIACLVAALCMVTATLALASGCGDSATETKAPPKSGGVMSASIEYPGGVNPSLAATADGWVVEAHESSPRDQVWYNVGHFDASGAFKWQGEPVKSGPGVEPGIAITDAGYIVMVHRSRNGNSLWYDTGKLDKTTGKISWLHSAEYETGSYPFVIVFNDGSVLEAHLSTVGNDHWHKVGTINNADNTVQFGGSISLEGSKCLAAFKDSDQFIQLSGSGYRFGKIDRQNKTIAWTTAATAWTDPNTNQPQTRVWYGASAYAYQPQGGGAQVACINCGPLTRHQSLKEPSAGGRELYLNQARVEGMTRLSNENLSDVGGGEQPAFACSGTHAIEMHRAAGRGPGLSLWYSTGKLTPR